MHGPTPGEEKKKKEEKPGKTGVLFSPSTNNTAIPMISRRRRGVNAQQQTQRNKISWCTNLLHEIGGCIPEPNDRRRGFSLGGQKQEYDGYQQLSMDNGSVYYGSYTPKSLAWPVSHDSIPYWKTLFSTLIWCHDPFRCHGWSCSAPVRQAKGNIQHVQSHGEVIRGL